MNLKSLISTIFVTVLIVSSTLAIPVSKQFTKLVVFGDSYSDNGNVYKLTNYEWPTSSSFEGRFSNGKVWPEYLSELLEVVLEDKAYGGATTDNDFIQGFSGPNSDVPVPGIKQQVDDYNLEYKDPEEIKSTIYAIWEIGNDYVFSNFQADPTKVVEAISLSLKKLATAGAKSFLVPDMPEISLFPFAKGSTPEVLASQKSIVEVHNLALDTFLKSFAKQHDVQIYRLPTVKLFEYLMSQKGQGSLKITDVSSACADLYSKSVDPLICENPDEYFYWDAFHPTTKIHLAIAHACNEVIKKSKN